MYSDLEGLSRLKLMYTESENTDYKVVLNKKIEKLKTWEHPRVTSKLKELRERKIL